MVIGSVFTVMIWANRFMSMIHVHVTKAGREAKIWLSPIRLEWNDGFRQHELRDILKIVEANKKVIEARWHERKNQ
jgi:hypothetical protein